MSVFGCVHCVKSVGPLGGISTLGDVCNTDNVITKLA